MLEICQLRMKATKTQLGSTEFDRAMMQRAIALALHGAGNVAPNPMVGCVITRGGEVIGEGYHEVYGQAHAEVNAIAAVSNPEHLREATLYVTLEPCAHQGKTPPCADLIIRCGIPKVVIGAPDPFPLVAGKGAARLREAGVEVIEHVEFDACREMNRRFFCFQEKKRPYVILKWAQTKDGFMDANRELGEQGVRWISGPETKKLVHRWRSEEASILVGRNTVINDNPLLTVREVSGKSPIRVVLSSHAELPENSAVLNADASTLILNNEQSQVIQNLEWIKCENVRNTDEVLQVLHARNFQSVFVEGGRQVLQSFLDAALWDEVRVITGETSFHNGLAAPFMQGDAEQIISSGSDTIRFYRNRV
jgi:diaminohydroxyphosphoribosylaminopyrimidine deaminase/5-amino-6-(5-phosphoribosylamino)uracil reductase